MNEETEIRDNFTQILNLNTAIVAVSRDKVEELLELAERHEEAADRYRHIADAISAGAQDASRLLADALVAEMGEANFAELEDDDE